MEGWGKGRDETTDVPYGDSAPKSKGDRLILINAITENGFLVPRFPGQTDDSRMYPESAVLQRYNLDVTTSSWVFLADSKHVDYRDNMDSIIFLRWVETSLIPCFYAHPPGKKMISMLVLAFSQAWPDCRKRAKKQFFLHN